MTIKNIFMAGWVKGRESYGNFKEINPVKVDWLDWKDNNIEEYLGLGKWVG